MLISFTLGWAAVCGLVTVALWLSLVFWPMPAPTGSYDFGGAFVGFLRLVCGVIATLSIWLVYFALLHG